MEYLCKCLNCETILYDENPQVDAQKKDPTQFDEVLPMEMINDDGETFWGCGNCQTDSYLSDEL
jgi:hypothetical protein